MQEKVPLSMRWTAKLGTGLNSWPIYCSPKKLDLRNRSAPVRELLSNNSLFGGQL